MAPEAENVVFETPRRRLKRQNGSRKHGRNNKRDVKTATRKTENDQNGRENHPKIQKCTSKGI